MGVKSLKEFNISLMGKWVWRVLEERDGLWSLVLRAKYGEECGRVRFAEGVGSIWRRHLNQIRLGIGLADATWLVDNIVRQVGDGSTTLFWVDPWLGDIPLATSYARLFELSKNKQATVLEMYTLGWGVGGEVWKWRLFSWEELLMGECVERLSVLVLQVGLVDRWVWKLHPSNKYTVQSAYSYWGFSSFSVA